MESLADRRKNRKPLIDADGVDQLGSDLDKLKQSAEHLGRDAKNGGGGGTSARGGGGLEDIAEGEEEEEALDEGANTRNTAASLQTKKQNSRSVLDPRSGTGQDDHLVFNAHDSSNAINGLRGSPGPMSPDGTGLEPDQNFPHSQFM